MITVLSDGGKRSGITYGSFKLLDENNRELHKESFVIGYGTSVQAEYETLVKAIEYCLDNEYTSAIFKVDSLLVLRQITGEYRCNYSHLKQARDKIRKLLKNFTFFRLEHMSGKDMKLEKNLGH